MFRLLSKIFFAFLLIYPYFIDFYFYFFLKKMSSKNQAQA